MIDEAMKSRALKSVRGLRQAALAFRVLGVLAIAICVIAALVASSNAPDEAATAATLSAFGLVTDGTVALFSGFAVGVLFDGLATMIELLALK